MDDEQLNFIRAQIKLGKSHDEVKVALISQGYSTQGSGESYAALCKELGIKPAGVGSSRAAGDPFAVSALVPDPATGEIPLPSFFSMIQFGVKLVLAQFRVVLTAATLVFIVTALVSLIPSVPNPYLYGLPYVVLSVAGFIILGAVSLLSTTAMVYAFIQAEDRVTFVQGWQWSLSRLWSIMWLWFLTACITLAGFAALVLPAIVFSIFNTFSLFVLAKDNLRGMDAIVRSTDLVMGAFWSIVGRLLLLLLVMLPAVIIIAGLSKVSAAVSGASPLLNTILQAPIILISLLTSAFFVGSLLCLFHTRTRSKTFFDASLYKGIRLSFWLLFWLGFLLPIGGLAFGMFAFNSFYDQYREQLESQFEADFSQFPSILNDGGEQVDQFIVERRVDTMFNAGMVHYGRMQSFDGVCSDVLIEAPARCQATLTTFVIDAPIGDGSYYCRDSGGFKGRITVPAQSAAGCQSR